MLQTHKEKFLVLLVLSLAIGAVFLTTPRLTTAHPDFSQPWDHHAYIAMANGNIFQYPVAPFGWRVLTPLLAKSLPFELSTNFTIISFASLTLTGFVLYFIFKKLKFSGLLVWVGLFYYLSLGWVIRFNLFDFWLTDPLSYLFTVFILWAILAKKDSLFLILLAIGVTAKENVLFAAPLYYTLNTQTFINPKLFWRLIALSAPAVFILLALRFANPPMNAESYNLPYLLETIALPRFKQLSGDTFFGYSTETFGVSLLFFAVYAVFQKRSLLYSYLPFIFLTYASLLFAFNTARVLVFAFPAVLILGLYGIQFIIQKTNVSAKLFLFIPVIIFICLLIKEYWHTLPGFYEALLLLALLAYCLHNSTKNEPDF